MENYIIAIIIGAVYAIVTFTIMTASLVEWSLKHNRSDARNFFLSPFWLLWMLKEIFKGLVWIIRSLPRLYRDAWK